MHSAKAVALGLLMAMALLFASPSLMFPAMTTTASTPPAGCHEHGKHSTPRPASYDCCRTGHDAALPQQLATPRVALVPVARTAEAEFASPVAMQFGLIDLAVSSSPPPGLTPLRV